MASSAGMGASFGFSPIAAVAYANPNSTTLDEVLDDDQISWLSMCKSFKYEKYIFPKHLKYFSSEHYTCICTLSHADWW